MAAYIKCTAGIEPLIEAINAQTDTWKIALTNESPIAKTSFVAGVDDLPSGNGYTSGGNAATLVSASQSGGVYSLILNSPEIWTSNTGDIGPFRYAALVDATQNIPVGFWDYGQSITLNGANGDTFQATISGAAITVS